MVVVLEFGSRMGTMTHNHGIAGFCAICTYVWLSKSAIYYLSLAYTPKTLPHMPTLDQGLARQAQPLHFPRSYLMSFG